MKLFYRLLPGAFAFFLIAGCTANPATTEPPNCPSPDGYGTISPAISIASIVFMVNDVRQLVNDGDSLRAQPGDDVRVYEVTLCVGSFSGDGGEACVDIVPTSTDGQEISSEHRGSHIFALSPGIMTIADLDFDWTVRESWDGLSAVLNHWAPTSTEDLGCSNGGCERDDWMKIAFE
jgi:hypothetical protein